MPWYEFTYRIYVHVLSKYFKFSGRAGRSEYWGFTLANLIVFVVILVAERLTRLDHLMISPLDLYWALVAIPIVALAVRRLHDIGKSGWWYLLILIPIIGFIVLLIWAARDSELQANRYGDRPKAPFPPPATFERFEIASELLGFMWTQRLWWMIPLVLVMLLFLGIIAFANATALGPFIYPLI